MNKPTIPNEVADVIKNLRNDLGYTNEGIVDLALKTGRRLHSDTVTLRKIPFDTLMAALVNGYEREMTEEERAHDTIRGKWIYASSLRDRSCTYEGLAEGILFTLDTLGVKVKGVND